MSEYQVKLKAKVSGLFAPTFEGVEIYEADSAKEAIEKARKEFNEEMLGHLDEVLLEIIDVSKI